MLSFFCWFGGCWFCLLSFIIIGLLVFCSKFIINWFFCFKVVLLFIRKMIRLMLWIVWIVFFISIFFNLWWGLWILGVLSKIIWLLGVVIMFCKWLWVVWVMGEVMVIFCLINWFIKVDLFILGWLIMVIKLEWKFVGVWGIVVMVVVVLGIFIEKIKFKNFLVYGGLSGKMLKILLS